MTFHTEIRHGDVPAAAGEKLTRLVIARFQHGWSTDLPALVADLDFALWRLRHHGASFSEFHARRVEERLKRGGPHRVLGTEGNWTGLLPIGALSLEPAEFRRRGREYFDWFLARNLRRDMTCIDYGCGSLRVGQHFIEYLDGGRYLGLDIVDGLYRDGLTMIGGKVITRSQPRFFVINEDSLRRARAAKPDLIFSTAVVQHVPPRELSGFFGNIIAMMNEKTTAVVHFKTAPMTTRVTATSWAHSPVSLISAIAAADRDMHARIEDAGQASRHHRRDALIFSRDAEKLAQWLRRAPGRAFIRNKTLDATLVQSANQGACGGYLMNSEEKNTQQGQQQGNPPQRPGQQQQGGGTRNPGQQQQQDPNRKTPDEMDDDMDKEEEKNRNM